MARTNIDLDESAVEAVMARFHFTTKKEAVNFALRTLAAEPMGLVEARAMEGSGWEGDLAEMRETRT